MIHHLPITVEEGASNANTNLILSIKPQDFLVKINYFEIQAQKNTKMIRNKDDSIRIYLYKGVRCFL